MISNIIFSQKIQKLELKFKTKIGHITTKNAKLHISTRQRHKHVMIPNVRLNKSRKHVFKAK